MQPITAFFVWLASMLYWAASTEILEICPSSHQLSRFKLGLGSVQSSLQLSGLVGEYKPHPPQFPAPDRNWMQGPA